VHFYGKRGIVISFRCRVVALVMIGLLVDRPARAWLFLDADEPVYSSNRQFYAVPAGAKSTVTRVFRNLGPRRSEKVWEKRGWNYVTNISDDGEYLVTGYDGNNVLDRNYTPDTVMLTFYRRSTPVRSVPLREIIVDVKRMAEWHEGFEWGFYRGFVAEHQFAVDTAEDRRLVYDVTTGALVEVLPSPTPMVHPKPPVPLASPSGDASSSHGGPPTRPRNKKTRK
jgi:hypothetical protein